MSAAFDRKKRPCHYRMLIKAFVRSINDTNANGVSGPVHLPVSARLKPRAVDRIEIGAGSRSRGRLTYIIAQTREAIPIRYCHYSGSSRSSRCSPRSFWPYLFLRGAQISGSRGNREKRLGRLNPRGATKAHGFFVA